MCQRKELAHARWHHDVFPLQTIKIKRSPSVCSCPYRVIFVSCKWLSSHGKSNVLPDIFSPKSWAMQKLFLNFVQITAKMQLNDELWDKCLKHQIWGEGRRKVHDFMWTKIAMKIIYEFWHQRIVKAVNVHTSTKYIGNFKKIFLPETRWLIIYRLWKKCWWWNSCCLRPK
jgi:hypothetical protein